jgi:hypothetical protein
MLKQWYSKRCVRKLNELRCEARRKVTERHKYGPDCGVWRVTFSITLFWEEHTLHHLLTTSKHAKKLELFINQ